MMHPRSIIAALATGLAAVAVLGVGNSAGQIPPPDQQPTQTEPAQPPVSQPAPQPKKQRPKSVRTTFLLSRAMDGGLPDGPSRNPFVSGDGRIARLIAFESDATNLVPGDTNGLTDVFVAVRRRPWAKNGSPWLYNFTALASVGLDGVPANGRSYRPVVDGNRTRKPSCIAFVSEASNLVLGDTNGKPDAFVLDLRSRLMERVSVNSLGQEADGATYDVSVDGTCSRVTFTSDAGNLAYIRQRGESTKGIRTNRPLPGTRQVYVRFRKAEKGFAYLVGATFLASASNKGRAGNSHSYDGELSRNGRVLVFTSEANNLRREDPNHQPDVYRRTISRTYMSGSARGAGPPVPRLRTRLVSATSSATSGNGPSRDPAVTGDGRYVVFETEASDLRAGDDNGVSDIARADMKFDPPHHLWTSHSSYGIGNGPSHRPAVSAIGWVTVFDSDASNLRPRGHKKDRNRARDMHQWYVKSRRVTVESRDSNNNRLRTGSQNPSMGLHGNYVAFESAEPMIDHDFATRHLQQPFDRSLVPPLIDPDLIGPVLPEPDRMMALHQIYVRYIGPCARTTPEDRGVQRCFLR